MMSEIRSLVDGEQPRYQKAVGAAQDYEWVCRQFEFYPEIDAPFKIEERYGGVDRGGYLDRFYAGNRRDLFLRLVFNSRQGLNNDQPSAIMLVRIGKGQAEPEA